jgi:hypothetical protein
MHPAILPDASPETAILPGGLLTGSIGQHQMIQIVLDLDPVFLQFFQGEIGYRHIMLFKIFDLARQSMIRRIQAGKQRIPIAQYTDCINHFRKFLVKIMVLDVHDRALPLFMANPMSGQRGLKTKTECLSD